jgi:hypothetical protein
MGLEDEVGGGGPLMSGSTVVRMIFAVDTLLASLARFSVLAVTDGCYPIWRSSHERACAFLLA